MQGPAESLSSVPSSWKPLPPSGSLPGSPVAARGQGSQGPRRRLSCPLWPSGLGLWALLRPAQALAEGHRLPCGGGLEAALWGVEGTRVRKGPGLKGQGAGESTWRGCRWPQAQASPCAPALPAGRSPAWLCGPGSVHQAQPVPQPGCSQGPGKGRLLSRDTPRSGCGLKLLSLPPHAPLLCPSAQMVVCSRSTYCGQRARLRMTRLPGASGPCPHLSLSGGPRLPDLFSSLVGGRVLQGSCGPGCSSGTKSSTSWTYASLCSWGRLWGQQVPACAQRPPPAGLWWGWCG